MKDRVKDFFGISSLFLFILTFSIAATILFFPLYRFSIWALDLPERLGMSAETLMENYMVLMEYLHFPWVTELEFPDFHSSPEGLFHFWEVKILFYINYAVLLVTAIGSFIYLRFIKKTERYWAMVRPFLIGIFAPFALLIFLALNFERLFVWFHLLLFNNDYWIFDPTRDPVINALPQEFFMYSFAFGFILMQLLIVWGYFWSRKKIKEKNAFVEG